MKTIGKLILGCAVIGVLGSCKHDYTCACVLYNSGTNTNKDTSFNNMVAKDAIYYCDKRESDFAWALANGYIHDTIANCELKKVK